MKNFLLSWYEPTWKNFYPKATTIWRSKVLRIMKLVTVIMLVLSVHLSATDADAQLVTLHEQNTELSQVLLKIRKQTNYNFLFNNQVLARARPVTVTFEKLPLRKALEVIFDEQPLTYSIIDRTIVIKEAPLKLRQSSTSPIPPLEEYVFIEDPSDLLAVIRGTVSDEDGEPLIGVNIQVKGTKRGTTTDYNGAYSIDADLRDTLVFSYIGYKRMEVPVGGRSEINVSLMEDLAELEELVVVGYGTQKKSDLTGAVSSINQDELTSFPANNALQAMQGRASGVFIKSTNGEPGSDYKIRIRGASSINASSDPLFVVDGIVGGLLPPPEDIASIEILKDASASAIYGSRGANGVVIITTKSGVEGKAKISLRSSYTSQKEIGRMEVLEARDFAEYINEARNSNFYDLNALEANTDWQDLIFQPGHIKNHQLSVSGGSENIQYYVSGIYYDQEGIIKTSSFDRKSLTTNLKFKISDHVRLSLNSMLRNSKREGVRTQAGGGNFAGVITAAQTFEPTVGVLDENGNYNDSKIGTAPFDNPLGIIDGIENENRQENLQSNLRAEIDLFNGLAFNSTFGFNFRNQRNGVYNKRISNLGETSNGKGSLSNRRNFNFITEQYLNYKTNFGHKNTLLITAGYSYQKLQNEFFSASNSGFISDGLSYWNLGAGTNFQAPSSNISESKIASFYGRFNYNYDERYLLTFSSRYDGASQFSAGNKWSFFPSGAFSWNVSNERFYPQNGTISAIKFRTSYGLTGNQGIGPYESLSRISPTYFIMNNVNINSVRPTSIANKDLTWETTSQFNIGLDIELLNGRVNFTGDYYIKNTFDLLFRVPVPSFSGYQDRLGNIGEMGNKGFEFFIQSVNLAKAFTWSTSLNLTLNKNKIITLPDGVDIIYSGTPGYLGGAQHAILREGEPVGSFYGFVYEGVYQEGDEFIPGGSFETEPGGEKFSDLNNDGVLNNDDRKIIGNPNPVAVWGLNNDFSYKGLSANIFFQASGGDILNFAKMELDRLSGNANATIDALNRWTPENTHTDVPKATAGRNNRTSTRFIYDGAYVRLKNISIGFNISNEFLNNLRIKNANIYLSGQNILTFTQYKGVDPEVAFNSKGTTDSNINLGLDYGSYPNTISYTVGLNLKF